MDPCWTLASTLRLALACLDFRGRVSADTLLLLTLEQVMNAALFTFIALVLECLPFFFPLFVSLLLVVDGILEYLRLIAANLFAALDLFLDKLQLALVAIIVKALEFVLVVHQVLNFFEVLVLLRKRLVEATTSIELCSVRSLLVMSLSILQRLLL